jgi:hypothetical protein
MNGLDHLDRTILLCRDYVADDMSGEEICASFQSTKILLVSDTANLASHNGQTALITLVALLGRMGMQIGLDIPRIEMIYEQPPFKKGLVGESLLNSSGLLVGGSTIRPAMDFAPDLTFALGNSKLHNGISADWRLVGGDWGGELVPDEERLAWTWEGEWPIGAMVSAALAAGEAFKHIMRGFRFRSSPDEEYFKASRGCAWNFESMSIPHAGLELGAVDIISAGAIAQAALYALLRVPGVQMSGRIFDDDVTGGSNLNRNMLTLVGDIGCRKANLVSERCASKFWLEPVFERFTKASAQSGSLSQLVLIGVDDIPSRWHVQTCAPGVVTVGGTSHFSVSSSSHRTGEACCGCLHPLDGEIALAEIPTVSFVSFWAGLLMAVRILWESFGRPHSHDQQHLWLTPLRMDLPHAAMWSGVSPRKDCPVGCSASRMLGQGVKMSHGG